MFPLAKLDRNTTADGLKKFILEEEAKYVATNLSALVISLLLYEGLLSLLYS